MKKLRLALLAGCTVAFLLGIVFVTYTFGTSEAELVVGLANTPVEAGTIPATDWTVLVLVAAGAALLLFRLRRRRIVQPTSSHK